MPSLTDGTWPGLSPARPPRDDAAITGAASHPPSVPTPLVPSWGVAANASDGLAWSGRGVSRSTTTPQGGSEPDVAAIHRLTSPGRTAYVDAPSQRDGGGNGTPAPIPQIRFYQRRRAHAVTLATPSQPVTAINSHSLKGLRPVAMRPLLTEDTHAKIVQLRDRIDDAFADGYVSPAERRSIRDAADDAADAANRTHRRNLFAAALMRCGGDDRYLSDIGARAGVVWSDAA